MTLKILYVDYDNSNTCSLSFIHFLQCFDAVWLGDKKGSSLTCTCT